MDRRKFLINGSLVGIGAGLISPYEAIGAANNGNLLLNGPLKTAKNIIFLVSDGMSNGTLTMTDLLMQRKEGKGSQWMNLYRNNEAKRALMDTASASSLVTDSAAAGSAWGGGVRVKNGSINVGANGEEYKPILKKFKEVGKSVGCVTSVQITHATPASFCVNINSRAGQDEIAEKYLDLKFDVMLGAGTEHFSKDKRKDNKDLFAAYAAKGYKVARTKNELKNIKAGSEPVMGVFHERGMPYQLDHNQDADLKSNVPTLAEMTQFAIDRMKGNKKGFVMQVEGGKVDWSAHANDTTAILYDQMAFDKAVEVAINFAKADKETLVIITTDHGNSNPGLFYGDKVDKNFEKFYDCKQTNEWVLQGLNNESTTAQIIERVEFATNCAISQDEALQLQQHFAKLDDKGEYNPYKLPFKELALIQSNYTSVGWAGVTHSADFVEVAMYGPGSEMLAPFVKNTDLHQFMLTATAVKG